ncbi:MAG: preprotein translocase subunit SecY [Chloroflexota bacterium]|jgi:preprotein translocase subunit SecY
MLQAVRNAWNLPDMRRKILFTFLILGIYRLAAHVPVPGVNQEVLAQLYNQANQGGANQLILLLDLLSGGAVANFSVLAMGVYPYITASIILQLLIPIIPQLEELSKEGEAGRNKINQYTYYLTIPLAALQAIGQARLFIAQLGPTILPNFGFTGENLLPTITMILAMVGGTMFAIWLGELITEQGVGNGLSIIIFGGIVARVPANMGRLLADPDRGWLQLLAFLVITAITMFVIVVVQEGTRRIPVQYGRRVRGRRMYAGGTTFIPLKVNTAGMIPLIFAQSILTFPAVIAGFFVGSSTAWIHNLAQSVIEIFNGTSGNPTYPILYFLMVVGFTYFYTDVLIQQQNLPETLQRQGGFIPGLRPGRTTANYITGVVRRITLAGAIFLGLVAVLPFLLTPFGLSSNILLISSAGLLIVVGVVIDTLRQLEAQLLMRHYEGFIR